LGKEELALTKKNLGLDPDLEFHVPDTVKNLFETAMKRGQTARQKWEKLFEDYEKAHPELAEAWRKTWDGELEENWDENLPVFQVGQDQPTRNASGSTLNAIAATTPWLISGDADIGSSTKSQIKDGGSFDGVSGAGRNLHYGVREHAMAALANGMAYHGGVRPIVSTFFTFVDYMRPSIRVAALSHLPVILLFSHDSLAVGEDGPTHQPIEQLASLRIMPNVVALRPGDPNEMVEAWRWCMQYTDGPVALITSRQDLPVVDRSRYAPAEGLHRGAYILAEPKEKPALVLLATGSELSLALETHERLAQEGIPIRIVSMPSWEIFQAQPQGYRDEVLPSGLPKVAVEAGVSLGWERWVGQDGEIIAVDRFGASAPGHVTMEKYGFTVDNLIEKVRKVLSRT
jgi:transketolase